MNSNLKNQYWQKVNRYLPYLNLIPFIKFCAVCNNLAFGKIDKNSDIDLFFIIKRGRLFTSRLLITLLIHILGVRRHGKEISGRFCLSFYIDDSAMNLEDIAISDDIYLSYWILTLIPIIDTTDLEGKRFSDLFLKQNYWIFSVLNHNQNPVYLDDHLLKDRFVFRLFRFVYIIFIDLLFGNVLEFIFKKIQLNRASTKLNSIKPPHGIIISDHILKFHNIDRRAYYRDKWYSRFGANSVVSGKKFLEII